VSQPGGPAHCHGHSKQVNFIALFVVQLTMVDLLAFQPELDTWSRNWDDDEDEDAQPVISSSCIFTVCFEGFCNIF